MSEGKHHDPNSACAAAWMRALKEKHHPLKAQAMPAVTRTQIFTVASVPVTDNQLIRLPATGGNTIPTNLGYRALEVLISLTTADKEAVGKTLALNVYVAPGDTFVAGFLWTSYGQQFTITDPDGTVHVDPDPTLHIPLANLAGQQVHLTYQAVGIATAGVTVNGLK